MAEIVVTTLNLQAQSCSKMGTVGPCSQTGYRTEIRLRLQYIQSVYGTPQNALVQEEKYGWYGVTRI